MDGAILGRAEHCDLQGPMLGRQRGCFCFLELPDAFLRPPEPVDRTLQPRFRSTAHCRPRELFPAEQARIVGLLIERIDIGLAGMSLRLRTDGLAALAREMRAKEAA